MRAVPDAGCALPVCHDVGTPTYPHDLACENRTPLVNTVSQDMEELSLPLGIDPVYVTAQADEAVTRGCRDRHYPIRIRSALCVLGLL